MALENGFHLSYKGGTYDDSGQFMGGTEILHLTEHEGKLFAAVGYWMDRPYFVATKDSPHPGAQIIRRDDPDSNWQLECTLPGPVKLVKALTSLTIETDSHGKILEQPVNILVGGSHSPLGFRKPGARSRVHTRISSATAQWVHTNLPNSDGEEVRAFRVYRDRETNVDMIFVTAGAAGIWVGTYDATLPGLINWRSNPELADLPLRPMSMAQINGKLYASSGASIYRRIDGPDPTWENIYTDQFVSSKVLQRDIGGIRGMTAVPSQVKQDHDAILYFLDNRMIRVEPEDNYNGIMELDITELFEQRTGLKTGYTLGAYNDILPILSPDNDEPIFLIGMMASIGPKFALLTGRTSYGNYDGGGWILIRNKPGQYELTCIDDPPITDDMPLIAIRSIVQSPFKDDKLYFAGFDCNFYICHNTSWIYEGSMEALRETARRSYQTPTLDPHDPANQDLLKKRAKQMLYYLDDNKDGKVTIDETRDGGPSRTEAWKAWFRSVDRDKDGVMSAGDLMAYIKS